MKTPVKSPRLVQDFLEDTASRLPTKTALVCGGRRLTYAELNAASERMAGALGARGLLRGDRVVLCLRNGADLVIGIFATLKAGGVFVAVNPACRNEKLGRILRHCGAAVLCIESARARAAPSVPWHDVPLRGLFVSGATAVDPLGGSQPAISFDAVLGEDFPAASGRESKERDLACLIYTSGTTGEPKAVMCEHGNVSFVTQCIAGYLQNTEHDTILNVLPLAFTYGLYQLMAACAVGATLVLEESFAFPARIVQRMQEERVTGFAGVPTIFAMLLGLGLPASALPALRYVTNAAAALPIEHIRRWRKDFPHVELYSMHGMTEVARTVYLPPSELERRPDSVGKAIPGTEVWLEDVAGRRVGPGEVGEMIIRGPHVMRGYWNDPEGTARKFPPGPRPGERICRSGDLFRMDDEGFLYFVSRTDDIIKSRGEKVAPREIEDVLFALSGVAEAAVVGVPHPVLGQAVKAFVVAAPGVTLTSQQVMAHCRARLEDFMVPLQVEFRPQLPKSESGKLLRKELR